ncbi:MAG: TadE/TadG family type IV pilus assembly protein [Hyphomicrobiaceae bacterium]
MRARFSLSGFLADRRGTAAIEFVLIANVLLVLLAAVGEIALTIRATRDVHRLASQLSLAVAQTCASTSCVEQLARMAVDRGDNYLITAERLRVSAQEVSKTNGMLSTSDGVGLSDPSAAARASAVLAEGDVGVIVTMTATALSPFAALLPPIATWRISATAVAVRRTALPVI